MYPSLENYINSIQSKIEEIPDSRKKDLTRVSNYIQTKIDEGVHAKLTFICTHNSRRSHMSQIWASAMASHFGMAEAVETYSGGTEATSFNLNAIQAMERAGFKIDKPDGINPKYLVKYDEEHPGMECWSKVFEDEANPSSSFGAVMTCSQADEACPFVPGADTRFSIPYEDPKAADGTPEQETRYNECCEQIATELLYTFSNIQTHDN